MFSEVAVPRLTASKAATIEPRIQTDVNKIIAIKNKPSSNSTVLSSIRNLSLPQIVFTVIHDRLTSSLPECDAFNLLERLLGIEEGK